MSKAILILDGEMPKCCDECEIFNRYEYLCCGGKVNPRETHTKPIWCPLKEMPDKYGDIEDDYMVGWNACIDEIEGEEHEQ